MEVGDDRIMSVGWSSSRAQFADIANFTCFLILCGLSIKKSSVRLSVCLSVTYLLAGGISVQYNTQFVKRHVAVASEALANRTVKKHRRRRTNVL